MHRTISIKHRIVRRVDIDKAPLATFDTVDLGDEDVLPSSHQEEYAAAECEKTKTSHQFYELNEPGPFVRDNGIKSRTIGGNNSKKPLSQAGGEEREKKHDRVRDKAGSSEVENAQEPVQSKAQIVNVQSSEVLRAEIKPLETRTQKTETTPWDKEKNTEKDIPPSTFVPTLTCQGTIGRVSIPIKKQDSDSSSPGSCSETAFPFQTSHPSEGHPDRSDAEGHLQELDAKKENSDSLLPEYVDPNQILSPSKRKAYERRIERLKVTTSPIARPRSTAPIHVVTLDEYAAISSPEISPATPSVVQDKLKITLPTDEFTLKPKTPKLHSAKKPSSDDTCFEFTEDILFSRTRSALVVHEDGQLPLSPRRVLIPPNLTPASSPNLSASPKLSTESLHQETTAEASHQIFSKDNDTVYRFFGATVDESEDENWANFSDYPQVDENGDFQSSDHDSSSNTICDSNEEDHQVSPLTGEDIVSSSFSASRDLPATKTEPADFTDNQLLRQAESQRPACRSHEEAENLSGQTGQNRVNFHAGIKPDSDIDFRHAVQCEGCSAPNTSCSVKHIDVSGIDLIPDFEPEEIVTIEINHSATSSEKHIEIEIKPTETCGSTSSPCSDGARAQSKPDSRKITTGTDESHERQRNSELHILSDTDNAPDLLCNLSSVGVSSIASSLQEVQQLPSAEACQKSAEPTLQQVQRTQFCITSPFSDQGQTAESSDSDTVAAELEHSCKHPVRAEQSEQKQTDVCQDLQRRPSSTNPFTIDFEPPVSNPFDCQFQQTSTNPFIEHLSPVTSDLIDFSSLENSSA